MGVTGINPGALNMLVNCAGVRPGNRVLIAVEPADFGYYSADLAPCVIAAAQHLGCTVEVIDTGFDPEVRSIPESVLARSPGVDVIVSLSRIGDQLRFDANPTGPRRVQCYALDAATLGSAFGTVPYAALVALRNAVDKAFSAASEIRISCGKGTRITGRAPRATPPGDTSCARFPLSVFSPILAGGFGGQVALPGFLIGTGSRYYAPFTASLPDGMFALLEHGRLAGFSGPAEGQRQANAQYDFVSARYGLDRNAVHSWHAGIHPGCGFSGKIARSYEAWSGSAFGNPRILHFHTCGAAPPGEICWNIIDPTIEADGLRLWDNGILRPELLQGGQQILADYPELACAFNAPQTSIGL